MAADIVGDSQTRIPVRVMHVTYGRTWECYNHNGRHFLERNRTMSDDKVDPSKKDPQISSADDLVKPTKKGDVELSEEELKRVSGGAIYMKFPGTDGEVTTQGHEKWIEL